MEEMVDSKMSELARLVTEAQTQLEALSDEIRGIGDEARSMAGWKLFDDHTLDMMKDQLDDIADGVWWLEQRHRPYLAGVQWRNDQAPEPFEGSPMT
ncbi:MAG: hypothetical protein M0Z92_14115 [Actinomycetota bacterium]|nr:hypothetical protein [Actinomycetota bacterium]